VDTPTDRARQHLETGQRYLRGGDPRRAHGQFLAAQALATDAAVVIDVLRALADVNRLQGRWGDALSFARQSQALALRHNLNEQLAAALNMEGGIYLQRGETHLAELALERALHYGRAPRLRGMIYQNLGTGAASHQHYDRALHWYQRSYAEFDRADWHRGRLLALMNLGNVHQGLAQYGEAAALYRQAAQASVEGSDQHDAELHALALLNLAETLALQKQELEHAHEISIRAIGHLQATGNLPHLTSAYRVLAIVEHAREETQTADTVLTHALRLAIDLGATETIRQIHEERLRLPAAAPTDPPRTLALNR
jgi:tetratricopeptide (TPR) repeat protein